MHVMIAGVADFDYGSVADLPLDVKIPADRVRIQRIRVVEGDALPQEGCRAERSTRGRLDASRERIVERHRRPQAARRGCAENRGVLAEAGLVDALRNDRSNKNSEAAADHQLPAGAAR